jgi:hypothetical protein
MLFHEDKIFSAPALPLADVLIQLVQEIHLQVDL